MKNSVYTVKLIYIAFFTLLFSCERDYNCFCTTYEETDSSETITEYPVFETTSSNDETADGTCSNDASVIYADSVADNTLFFCEGYRQ